MSRAIADKGRTIRIPVHMVETVNRLVRATRSLVQRLGREPSAEELAQQMEMPLDRVQGALKIVKEPISLETPVGDEEQSSLGDLIEDQLAPSPIEAAIQGNLGELTSKVLATLTPREEQILRMRFGIGQKTECTLLKRSAKCSPSHANVFAKSRRRRCASSARPDAGATSKASGNTHSF
jgi:RNA polymerase primary sigma factor